MKTLTKRLITTAVVAALLSAPLAISTSSTAEARDWRGGGGYRGGHYHHGGGNTGAYIGLGLGALALGSVLAYSATQPTYVAPPAYYAPPPPPPAYYAPPATYYYPPATTFVAPPDYGAVYDPYTNTYKQNPDFERYSR